MASLVLGTVSQAGTTDEQMRLAATHVPATSNGSRTKTSDYEDVLKQSLEGFYIARRTAPHIGVYSEVTTNGLGSPGGLLAAHGI